MTTLQHGAYLTETAFDITRHDYAEAGHTDYVELLEILNPPKGKDRFAVNHYNADRCYHFCETSTQAIAKKAFLAVANRLTDIQGAWEKHGIEKMYRTHNPIVSPWFYSTSKQLFGNHQQFTTIKKMTSHGAGFSAGQEYLLFSETPPFSFETVAGIHTKDSVVWESGRSSSAHSLRKISSYAKEWESRDVLTKWMKFLTTGEPTEIEIEFPIWTLALDLSFDSGEIYLQLSIEEEFKGQKAHQTYWKDRKKLPKRLIFTNPDSSAYNSMIDVLKFFIAE